jgi:apolipoprotein N-acyltransferase
MNASLRALAPLLAGSLLIGFSQGSWLLPIAAWVGPVLVLRYARDHAGWRGFVLVFAAMTLATFIGFGGVWANRGPIMVAGLTVGFGLLWSLPYLADRLLHGRLPGFASTLAFPLALATVDFAIMRTSPLGSWGALGFTQYGNLPVMQLASVTGMVGRVGSIRPSAGQLTRAIELARAYEGFIEPSRPSR